jgi:aspartyl-tRNA(Asn)/glutamyl-tRNA(Gln) amidotransferase subunit B
MKQYQLPAGDAEVFKNDVSLGDYFEGIAKQSSNPKSVANWIINNLRAKIAEQRGGGRKTALTADYEAHGTDGAIGEPIEAAPCEPLKNLQFKPEYILELIALVDARTISSSSAQLVFEEMFNSGRKPALIVQERGLAQVNDTGAMEKFCSEAIAANPGPAADFRAGKAAALNFLKGQVMKLSKGKANPAVVGDILERLLNN